MSDEPDPDNEDMGHNDDDPPCPECGSTDVAWIDCDACGGEGGRDHDDLMAEDPLWYFDVDWETCSQCQGKGGWWHCFACEAAAFKAHKEKEATIETNDGR